jgi:hypothetical protein
MTYYIKKEISLIIKVKVKFTDERRNTQPNKCTWDYLNDHILDALYEIDELKIIESDIDIESDNHNDKC